jgi:ubiquitin-protein ligase
MDAKSTRVNADIEKIRDLAKRSNGGIELKSSNNTKITLQLNYKTVADSRGSIRDHSLVTISLSPKYPFTEPKVVFDTPVFHPNVYSSGQVCLGTKWLPTEGLNLLVERLIKILIFEATILNTKSPANSGALTWYRSKVSSHPNFFPTDRFSKNHEASSKTKIKWKSTETIPEKKTTDTKVISCKNCNQKLRVPDTRDIKVTCRKCGTQFLI